MDASEIPRPSNVLDVFFPQIAIAIGVLTSKRGEGDEPLWWIGVGCHCSVLWLGGRVTTNFRGVPL